MWQDDKARRFLALTVLFLLLVTPATGLGQCLYVHDGEYTLSTPATRGRPLGKLPPEVGRPIAERLLKPEHMMLTGLGEHGQETLRVGGSTKAELVGIFGLVRPLPLGWRCVSNIGYASARPGDSTLIVVGMGNACLDNPDYAVRVEVFFSPAVLPKDYRPQLKRFVPSVSVHANLATKSGLRLGLTRKEVETILGAPIWKEKDAYFYGVCSETELPAELLISRWSWPKDTESKRGFVDHSITIRFVGGRASAFSLVELYDM